MEYKEFFESGVFFLRNAVFLPFLLVLLAGCADPVSTAPKISSISKETAPAASLSRIGSGRSASIVEDAKTVQFLTAAVQEAQPQPGIVNMAKADYMLALGDAGLYYVWLTDTSVAVRSAEDSHSVSVLTEPVGSQFRQLLHDLDSPKIAKEADR